MKITLSHNMQVLEVKGDSSLMTELKSRGFNIKTTCDGFASCAECIVKIVAGAENINQPTFEEKQLLGNVFHITKERLSCQTRLNGDITVDITRHLENSGSKGTTTKLKKKENIEKPVEQSQEKNDVKDESPWYRHWEKDAEEKKRLGGNKRPKTFKYDNDNDNEN